MKFKSILSRIITVVSILLMVGAVFILFASVMTSKNSVPSLGGYSVMRVVTGSMEPALPTKSLVLVKRLDGEENPQHVKDEVALNDIITFYSADPSLNGMQISHRVVGIQEIGETTYYTTKGDANILEDQYPVSPSQIMGKVVWCSSSLGKIVSLMLNPLVFFPLIITPLLVLIILNLRASVRNIKSQSAQNKEEAIREAIEAAKAREREEAEQDDQKIEKHDEIDT